MNRWIAIALVAAACGGGGAAKGPHGPTAPHGANHGVGAASIRARVKAACGKAYATGIDGKADGCDWIDMEHGRGKLTLEANGDTFVRLGIELSSVEQDLDAVHAQALDLAHDLFDDSQRAIVATALRRIYRRVDAPRDTHGWVGSLYVQASTEIDVADPEAHFVFLSIEAGRQRDAGGSFAPVRPSEFASPAKPVTDAWIADAKAACTELIAGVLKSHKATDAPANWTAGKLHVECLSPDENSVAHFVVTWAPDSKKPVYVMVIAEMLQKQYAKLVDRLLVPVLTPGQLAVARVAAKKEPLDRAYEAEGLQFTSRHDKGGFFGETHEIHMTVLTGFGAGAAE